MAKIDEVIEQMHKIGDKFSLLATEKISTKQARDALAISKSAYKFAIELEERKLSYVSIESDESVVRLFLSGVNNMTLRSQVWGNYLEFCEKFSYNTVRKSDFMMIMETCGYRIRRSSQGWVIIPPDTVSPTVKSMRQQLRLLENSFDGGIDRDSEIPSISE